MDSLYVALKIMHLPAGVVARGLVEGSKYFTLKSEKLQNFSEKIFRGYGTEFIGVGIPTLDTILEYYPQFKDVKDGIVCQVTGASHVER